MIGLVDMLRGVVELLVQGIAVWREHEEGAGRPPKLEARRVEGVDRWDAWLRFRGVRSRTNRKGPHL